MRRLLTVLAACCVFALAACDSRVPYLNGVDSAPAFKAGQRIDRNLPSDDPAGRPRVALQRLSGITIETGRLRTTIDGERHELQTVTSTPSGPGPFPLAVISHGSPRGGDEKRKAMTLGYLMAVAEFFARRGYRAVVFARRGFAASSGRYSEHPGDCDRVEASGYVKAGRAAAMDYAAVIETAASDPAVDRSVIVAIGQSTGGFSVTALAADPPPGLIGVVNFSGGRGSERDLMNCNARALALAFKSFGRTASVPSLWLYSVADRFFWPELVARNFDLYARGGAPVRLEQVGPLDYSSDGHNLVLRPGGNVWRPLLDAFLARIGAPASNAPPD